jgi:large subunit ribosomal protein L20
MPIAAGAVRSATRQHGLTYGQLISGLKAAGVGLDRKSLADLALDHPAAFEMLAKQAAAKKPAPKAASRA